MAPRPEERYQTPAELIQALQQLPVCGESLAPRRRYLWIAAASVAFLVLAGIGLMIWVRGRAPADFDNSSPLSAQGNAKPPDTRGVPTSPPKTIEATKTASNPAVVVDKEAPELLKTFTGHTGEVTWVAIAPDGATFASAGFDKTVRLWRPDEDESIATLRHKDKVQCVAYAPDGKTLATCTDEEGAVRLWDVATHAETFLGQQKGPWGMLRSVAFREDGRLLASGSMAVFSEESVKLWDVLQEKVFGSLGPAKDRGYTGIYGLAFCPGTKLLAVAHNVQQGPGVRLWDTETKEELHFLAGPAIALAFSPDGLKLATAQGENVALWTVKPEKKSAVKDSNFHIDTARFSFPPKFACCAAFAPDNRTLAVAYNEGTVVLWNTQTSERLASFPAHEVTKGPIIHYRECSVAFTPNGKMLLTGGFDHKVKLWKLPTVSAEGDSK